MAATNFVGLLLFQLNAQRRVLMIALWSSAIYVAFLAAICYGLSSPMAKVSMVYNGVSPSGMLLAYGLCGTVMSLIWNSSGVPISFGSSYRGFVFALVAGLLSSTAYLSMNRGITLGSITLVLSIVTAAPLISSCIEIFFMQTQMKWQQALCGIALVVVGVVLVATSRIRIPVS